MVDVSAVTRLPETGAWEGVPRLENGWRPTGGAVNPGADEGLLNWPTQVLAARTKILKDRVDLLSQRADVEVTVGTGGQFATINEALAHLSERRPGYKPGGFVASVRLRPGFVMREQVIVAGANLGWIRIISDDAEVQIDRAYLTAAIGAEQRYPAFSARGGGQLPSIEALFTMMATGAATRRDGILVMDGGGVTIAAGKGVKAAGSNGITAMTGAVVSANGADFRNAVEAAAMIHGGSRAAMHTAILRGSKRGIDAGNGAVVHAASVDCAACSEFGIIAQAGASVNAHGASCRGGSTDAATDIVVQKGSIINAFEATGGTSVTPNTISAAGIIFK